MNEKRENPLGYAPIGGLLVRFAVPAIISGLVGALYNIVDQIFIGQKVGLLGNAATNIAFPLTTICLAIALLLGVGSASNFSLALGRGDPKRAAHIAGNGIAYLVLFGVTLAVLVGIFLEPLLNLFGATTDVLPLALTYTGITAIGMPFNIIVTGGSQLVRADGSPKYAMVSSISGAVINVGLDALFMLVFDWGIMGAALATIIGQIFAASLILFYFMKKFKTVKLARDFLRPKWEYLLAIMSLGASACFNQLAMTLVQIVLNNVLKHYGELSIYGSEIPLACVGVITKVNVIVISFTIGIAQGCQPIFGFNYGARNYPRVKKAYRSAFLASGAISILAFLCFQIFPRQIVSIFGSSSEVYFRFAERYFRIYMMMVLLNGIQPLSSILFTSIGKAKKGIFLSMTRQILFLLPLVVLFPLLFGIDGVMYAAPIADFAAATVSILFVAREFRNMTALERLPEAEA